MNPPAWFSRPGRRWVGILASAGLLWLYARGGAAWPLGFVALLPWLLSLDRERSLGGALLSAWAMSVAATAAMFGWFGSALGAYTQWGDTAGLALLLLAAPLFQPQYLALAGVRHLVRASAGRTPGPAGSWPLRPKAKVGAPAATVPAAPAAGPVAWWLAWAGPAAWVAAESLLPRLFDDSLGHGLYDSRLLRQAADLAGAGGLTLVLLLAHEALAAAWARRQGGWRAVAGPLALALAGPLLLAGYGALALQRLQATPPAEAPLLRMGLVQSNLHDYERLRAEKGAAAVVREVLDTHFAMSYDAVERQRVDAVLWSETVYPTTFGQPKSEAGAELDQEILAIVRAAGVPFVFGTYDSDAAGEYNAAAFVEPGRGHLGSYRKTRLFPLTEWVPAWLEAPRLRQWLPWAGRWQPGSGARVFPLRLADGREVPVLPMICLDDVDAGLAIDGARLGARALLTMSNDAWFSTPVPGALLQPTQGARLHQAVAAFRSIETRLPQFRVTTTGHSSAIDASGELRASTRLGERTLLVSALPVGEPPRTLMVAWGDWLGGACAAALLLLAVAAAWRRRPAWDSRRWWAPVPAGLPAQLLVLPPAARVAAGMLRVFARGALLWLLAEVLWGEASLPSRPLLLMRYFAVFFLAPEAAAWCLLRAFAAQAHVRDGQLLLSRGARQLVLSLGEVARIEPWRLPLPGVGCWLRLRSGERWGHGLLCARGQGAGLAEALARELARAGATAAPPAPAPSGLTAYRQALLGPPRCVLARRPVKFLLLPGLLALPAFRLHQHIAYGGSLGEYFSFGALAYLLGLAIWWASWIIGVVLCAAALRSLIEAACLVTALVRPQASLPVRRALELAGLALLYLGLPLWLLVRTLLG